MINLKDDDLIKTVSYASVFVALTVLLAKCYGFIITESQSILASLIDSALDVSSSVINLIAIKISLSPPDNNHRFGHEKFQDLAVFSQSTLFFASGIFMMFSSIRHLMYGARMQNPEIGGSIMIACTILTVFLIIYQKYVIKRTRSKIVEADHLHYFSDLLTNIVVIISIYLSGSFWYIDSVGSIAISLYIIYSSYQLFRFSLHNLADEEFADADKQKILKIVGSFKEVLGVHELKTRTAANKLFIQFHLEMKGEMSLYEAHEISDQICDALHENFPNAEIIIHQDPGGLEEDVKYREQIPIQ